jgi:hypothetical protein
VCPGLILSKTNEIISCPERYFFVWYFGFSSLCIPLPCVANFSRSDRSYGSQIGSIPTFKYHLPNSLPRFLYSGSRIASPCMTVDSSEPDEVTEDMHSEPQLVPVNFWFDRLNLQEKALARHRISGYPGQSTNSWRSSGFIPHSLFDNTHILPLSIWFSIYYNLVVQNLRCFWLVFLPVPPQPVSLFHWDSSVQTESFCLSRLLSLLYLIPSRIQTGIWLYHPTSTTIVIGPWFTTMIISRRQTNCLTTDEHLQGHCQFLRLCALCPIPKLRYQR